MKPIDILAVWVIFQLLVIGIAGASILNDRIDCIPEPISQAYDDRFGYYISAAMFPIALFIPQMDVPVNGCPQVATTTASH